MASDPRPKKTPVERAEGFVDKAIESGQSPLAALMSSRARPSRYMTFPGFDDSDAAAQFMLVALSDAEFLDARLDAHKFILGTKKLEDWLLSTDEGQSMLANEVQTQILWRAMRRSDNVNVNWAATANELRLYLEPGERAAIWNEYAAFQHERSPTRALRSDAEVDELIAALGKDSLPHAALSFYDSPSLRSICISLADRLTKLMKQHSSAT